MGKNSIKKNREQASKAVLLRSLFYLSFSISTSPLINAQEVAKKEETNFLDRGEGKAKQGRLESSKRPERKNHGKKNEEEKKNST